MDGGAVERRTAVLVGVTGDGKSSTGNTVCGREAFTTSCGLRSETRDHAVADFRLDGKFWRVIDTIGLEDTCLPQLEVLRRFSLFADDCPDGVDAFLFVVRYGRFKPEHEAALAAFARNVGDDAFSRTVLVFTHCPRDPAALDAELASAAAPSSLRETWLPRCAGAVGIDNVGDGAGARARIQGKLDALVAANGGDRYGNAAIDRARERAAASAEEEAAAFAACVADWRKAEGPLVVERDAAADPRTKPST